MSAANPVDPKAEAAKATAPALAALSAAPAVKKRPWSRFNLVQKFWILVIGSGVAIAAGAYGYKYFSAKPGSAVAQTDTAPKVTAPAAKPSEPDKPSPLISMDDVPDVVVPPVKKVQQDDRDGNAHGIKLPIDIPSPRKKTEEKDDDDGLPPIKAPVPVTRNREKEDEAPIVLPPIPGKKPDTSDDDDEAPPIVAPPNPDSDKRDNNKTDANRGDEKTKRDDDLFKAPAPNPSEIEKKPGPKLGPAPSPLPTEIIEKKEKVTTPVIRISAQDTPPPPTPGKVDPPPAPKLDLDLPPVPAAPTPDRKEEKKTDSPAVVSPPVKSPMLQETPEPPAIKSPMIPDGGPPAVRTRPEEKKENFLEDWHTYRAGDNAASICQEYYRDVKYAKALDAYNKGRFSAKDNIVFVPPIYVLEERFGHLIETSDRPATPEIRPTSNIKFEPAVGRSTSPRPAPPAAGSNDEYRVTSENGEMIRDIARKVYGSEESWRKLWDLNQSIDPTRPIPNGTALRLGR